MNIKVVRFGEILTSRPEGREAGLVMLASDLRNHKGAIEIDFEGVQVMTPSWLSEFIKTLNAGGMGGVTFLNTSNVSVSESIRFVQVEKTA